MFVRLDDPEEVRLETCGRPICPDDEVRLVDDDGREVRRRRGRRAPLPRPLHAARLLRRARAQRARLHPRRLLPLRRPDAAPPDRQLRRRGPQEGPDQPRRREDQRRGGREPHPRPPGGAERRLRAGARRRPRRADVRLHRAADRGPDAGRARSRSCAGTRSPRSSCRSGWRCSTPSRSHRSARSPSRTSSPGSPEPQIRRSGRRPSSTYFAIGAVPPSRCHCSSAAK